MTAGSVGWRPGARQASAARPRVCQCGSSRAEQSGRWGCRCGSFADLGASAGLAFELASPSGASGQAFGAESEGSDPASWAHQPCAVSLESLEPSDQPYHRVAEGDRTVRKRQQWPSRRPASVRCRTAAAWQRRHRSLEGSSSAGGRHQARLALAGNVVAMERSVTSDERDVVIAWVAGHS